MHTNHHIALGIRQHEVLHYNDSLKTTYFQSVPNHFEVFGKRWGFFMEAMTKVETEKPLALDYLVVVGNPRLWDIETIYHTYDADTLIFDGSSSPYRVERWEMQCDSLGIAYRSERKEGAICLEF